MKTHTFYSYFSHVLISLIKIIIIQEFLGIICLARLVLDDIICRLISKHNFKKKKKLKKLLDHEMYIKFSIRNIH